MTRMDVCTPRPRKDGKTFWLKIGSAWPKENGSFSVSLDALPIPDAEGRCSLMLFPEKDKQNTPGDAYLGGASQSGSLPSGVPQRPVTSGPDPEDEIPFAPEWRG